MSSKCLISKSFMLNNMLKVHFRLYIKRKTITFATEIFNLIQVYMKETSNYYRIKTEWTKEDADGQLQKTKTEELVYATSYSEAEATAYALIESENRERDSVMPASKSLKQRFQKCSTTKHLTMMTPSSMDSFVTSSLRMKTLALVSTALR